jgi:hypothetical protein
LNYDFSENVLLTSNFFKNRKNQVDYKNNTINFIKKDYLDSSKNSKILYNYNDFLEVNR